MGQGLWTLRFRDSWVFGLEESRLQGVRVQVYMLFLRFGVFKNWGSGLFVVKPT